MSDTNSLYRSVKRLASDLTPKSRIRIHYNSARSDERQSAEGNVISVKGNFETKTIIVKIKRDDGQIMSLESTEGKVNSEGQWYSAVGYSYEFEIISQSSSTAKAETPS